MKKFLIILVTIIIVIITKAFSSATTKTSEEDKYLEILFGIGSIVFLMLIVVLNKFLIKLFKKK
ncbi:MAG: hypothetical protein WCI41_02140 [bacterium]